MTSKKTAAQILRELEASKPVYGQRGSAAAQYEQALRNALARVNGRAAFSYDVSSDPVYAQYARQYARQGRRASAEAAANAAALTGGYGNSYAATAGNQAYLNQMTALTDMIPALYAAAYDRYAEEGEALAGQAERYQSLMGTELSRYKAELSAWQKERDYYAKRAAEEALAAAAARAAQNARSRSGRTTVKAAVKTDDDPTAGRPSGGVGASITPSKPKPRLGRGGGTAL